MKAGGRPDGRPSHARWKTCWRRHRALPSPTVTVLATRTRRRLAPPSGFGGHLSRREAAALLGLASEYKVRQLEKEGRLRPVRGVMGSAWYARADVLALRPLLEGERAPHPAGPPAP